MNIHEYLGKHFIFCRLLAEVRQSDNCVDCRLANDVVRSEDNCCVSSLSTSLSSSLSSSSSKHLKAIMRLLQNEHGCVSEVSKSLQMRSHCALKAVVKVLLHILNPRVGLSIIALRIMAGAWPGIPKEDRRGEVWDHYAGVRSTTEKLSQRGCSPTFPLSGYASEYDNYFCREWIFPQSNSRGKHALFHQMVVFLAAVNGLTQS